MPSAQEVLRLLPFAPKTGIGSLPHAEVDAALRLSFTHELPFLPELPARSPTELMLPAALERLPGLGRDGTIDVEGWRKKRDPFGFEVEQALSSGELSGFEPAAHACLAPFLSQVHSRRLPLAKVQLAGPATARWYAKTSSGEPASEIAELDQQIFRLLLARTLALVSAVKRAGATPIVFLDEPGLIALDPANARHGLLLQELKLLIHSAQKAGGLVGIHCCGNTDWAALLGLGLDVLSFDARLSIDAVLEERAACQSFFASGATFALGLIPTDADEKYAVPELVDAIEVSLRATIPRVGGLLGRMILTPACGLGGRTVEDAERILAELAQAQLRLKALA
ncbi:MAG: hypothetical protein H6Q89_3122 [Myxococcaceae bacterium]|nr:hypothetical protein [Myxococcaceae bacterium]